MLARAVGLGRALWEMELIYLLSTIIFFDFESSFCDEMAEQVYLPAMWRVKWTLRRKRPC